MNQIGPALVTIISSIIGLAIIAVLVSQRAQTGNVLTSGGTALSSVINAAVSPVSGTSSGFGNASNVGGIQNI